MTDEFLATSSVIKTSGRNSQLSIPVAVEEALDDADRICWFIDRDTDLLYVVPEEEVTIR